MSTSAAGTARWQAWQRYRTGPPSSGVAQLGHCASGPNSGVLFCGWLMPVACRTGGAAVSHPADAARVNLLTPSPWIRFPGWPAKAARAWDMAAASAEVPRLTW